MADGNRRGTGDDDRSLEALWNAQNNLNKRMEEVTSDLFRLTVDMRREFQSLRNELRGNRPTHLIQPTGGRRARDQDYGRRRAQFNSEVTDSEEEDLEPLNITYITSWERRVAVLLAAARGICYLHYECETKIIHRDIKPENILIAEDWTAKIADFGLAKLLNKNQTRAATQTLAAGTEGYVAPECEREVDGSEEAQVSEKADVYSYGIVVLETICSKRNREVKVLRKLSLCEMVRESYEANELWKLVDGDEVAAPDLEKLVKIGLLCAEDDPNARPVMEDVVMMLEGDIDVPTLPSVLFSL
ncbi:hypothetical protein M5K25_001269 [Dendrobium thyrsiflorum]|uniref:Protein kinase domain-containing protein n=1 Tax=Dendrobium thyrsiflorum TaxID=117978 RepID=A0ABD0VYM9_DENTH